MSYTPQARSLAGRLIADLEKNPRTLTSREIGKLFDVPSASVGASMKAAVQYGAVMMRIVKINGRDLSEYYPVGFVPPEVDVVDAEPAARKKPPLEIAMYDDGDVYVRGHRVAVNDDGTAVFTAKQMAYLVARVCTPVVEVAP